MCFSAFLRVEACLLLLECGCDLCACSFVCVVPCILVRVCTFMSCMMDMHEWVLINVFCCVSLCLCMYVVACMLV